MRMPAGQRGPSATLYQAVLGAEFDGLAPVLRRFHGRSEGGRACGRLRVVRGRGPLARFVGLCIGAPAHGDDVPVDMSVSVADGRELWIRSFAGSPLVTRQWREGTRLAEALGPSTCLFDLEREGEAMVFVQRGCRLLGIPLPRWLSPRIRARVEPSPAGDDAWHVDVEIAAPFIGTIIGYSGIMVVNTSA
jgi:hypothetical protein